MLYDMRKSIAAGAALILCVVQVTTAQTCAAGTAKELNGNWYCSEVDAITYTNFPGTGSYNKITKMDVSTGQCTSERYSYSGSLSPLNEELSLHVRGPVWLTQIAVYTPSVGSGQRGKKVDSHEFRHGHQHIHRRNKKVSKHKGSKLAHRDVGDLVTATIDGQVVHWTNSYTGVTTSAPAVAASDETHIPTQISASSSFNVPTSKAPASSAISQATSPSNAGSSSWDRQAYYHSALGTSEGITFLNHFGGSASGTADGGSAFGASLSYASSDGKSGAGSAKLLSNTMLDDNVEVVIMSNKSCDDGGCGYTRPGGVAYHGFGGDHKIFLLEFSMPSTGKTGFNADMPAIWLHNAQIPLTSQYGTNPDCSCWTSGCGEFDLFEILDSGNFRCKSTLHMAPAGGSSDYFHRPTQGTIKVAVVFTGDRETAHIQILDDDQTFDGMLSAGVVDGFTNPKGNGKGSSLFKLSG